jgi:hypothetical protein
MSSQNQLRYLNTIDWTLLALLCVSDLVLKPPKDLVVLAIECMCALYSTAALIVGLKDDGKKAQSLRSQ